MNICKIGILLLFIHFTSTESFCQHVTKMSLKEISKETYTSCLKTSINLKRKENVIDTLSLQMPDSTVIKYLILGRLKSTNWSLMKSLTDQSYYLINDKTGWVEGLLGYPVFSSTFKEFACFGNSFGESFIKLYEIKDIEINLIGGTRIINSSKPTEIHCVHKDFIYVSDSNGKYWNYMFQTISK